MTLTRLLLLSILLLGFFKAESKIQMPSLFCDNMILQQQSHVLIWGKATPNKTIRIKTSWDSYKYTTNSDTFGKWQLRVHTPQAGGPFTLCINDGTEIQIKNILIGEVWLCSGQSNMDVPVGGVNNIVKIKDSQDHITNSRNPDIRLFTVKKQQSSTPEENCIGEWKEASPESVSGFSAVGYLYAEHLHEALGVPVGIIKSACSGTKVEAWMSDELLKEFGKTVEEPAGPKGIKAAELYNGMIRPLMGYTIKGFLWYQGEGNHRWPDMYKKLLPAMVNEWRTGWKDQTLPFYFVQIAPYTYADGGNSAFMRQAMTDCVDLIPNSNIAILTDAGEEFNIHPMDKDIVAKRLLYCALAGTYCIKEICSSGPVFESATKTGNKILVKFRNSQMGLTSFEKELKEFELAAADSVFVQAKAKITKEGVEVWNEQISEPIWIRYAFKDWVKGELFNFEGLPASSFQTFKIKVE